MRYHCPACGHVLTWVDTNWVCTKRGGCGAEWPPRPTWEAVRQFVNNTGDIVYWRYVEHGGRSLGGMSRQPDGMYRAYLYRYRPGAVQNVGRTELGFYPTWQSARRAVVAAHEKGTS